MDGNFDDINGPKHERVAKALEQVNGFRYRTDADVMGDRIIASITDGSSVYQFCQGITRHRKMARRC